MDYSWLNELNQLVSSTKLFSATIIGAKSLAMTIILFRVIGNFISTGENPEAPKIGGIMNIIGYGLIIVGSDWVVNAIEGMFSGVDLNLAHAKPIENKAIKNYLSAVEEGVGQKDVFDKISFYIELLPLYINVAIMRAAESLLKILDIGVVGMYLIQRIFLLQLFKIIFPFAIAFSTINSNAEMLMRWIKIYIGLFFLGIAYAGIIKFTDTIQGFIQSKIGLNVDAIQFDTPLDTIFAYTVGALLISFLVKLALFGLVTKEVRNFFN